MPEIILRHPSEHAKVRILRQSEISEYEPLLVKIVEQGKLTLELPQIEDMRRHRRQDVERLDPGVRRIMNPHIYHVSLTQGLWDLKQELIQNALSK